MEDFSDFKAVDDFSDFKPISQDGGDEYSTGLLDPSKRAQNDKLFALIGMPKSPRWDDNPSKLKEVDNFSDFPSVDDLNAKKQAHIADVRKSLLNRDRAFGINADPQGENDINFVDQGLLGIGQAAQGLKRSGYGAVEGIAQPIKFLADWASAGAKKAGKESQDYVGLSEADNKRTPIDAFANWFGALIPSAIPSAIGGRLLGGKGEAIAGGIQSFGSTFEDAKDAYMAQGLKEVDARLKATIPAALSGAITGLITGKFGDTGLGALKNGLTGQAASQIIKHVAKEMGLEALEEASDEAGQQLVQRLSYDPQKTIWDAVQNIAMAGAGGAVMAGTFLGAQKLLNTALTPSNPTPTPPLPTGANLRVGRTVDPRYSRDPNLYPEGYEGQIPFLPASYGISRASRRGAVDPQLAAIQSNHSVPTQQSTQPEIVDPVQNAAQIEPIQSVPLTPPAPISPVQPQLKGGELPNEVPNQIQVQENGNQKPNEGQEAFQKEVVSAPVVPIDQPAISIPDPITGVPNQPVQVDPAPPLIGDKVQNVTPKEKPLVNQPTVMLGEAKGPDQIADLVEKANVSQRVKDVVHAMLASPVMRKLDFGNLQVQLFNSLENKALGGRDGGVIGLAENMQASTFPHEVFHVLHDMIPANDKLTLEMVRKEALEDFLKTRADIKPESLPKSMIDGHMTSKEFVQSGLPMELYKFSNPSEFLAMFAGDKFANDHFNNRNNSVMIRLWHDVRAWFRGLMDSLKRVVGLSPDIEQLYRELLSGKHQNTPETGLAREVQNSFSYNDQEARTAEKLAATTGQKESEAIHQSVQGNDAVDLLTKHGAVGFGIPAKVMTALDAFNLLGISAVGVRLNQNVKEGYQAIKARLKANLSPSDFDMKILEVARIAAQKISSWEGKLRESVNDGADALKELQSQSFIRLQTRELQARMDKFNSKAIADATRTITDLSLKKAYQALDQQAKTDQDVARLQGEINQLTALQSSSFAVGKVAQDIISTLNSSPAGKQMLNDPSFGTRPEIFKEYEDLKKSSSQPMADPKLVRFAIFMLHNDKNLRNQLLAVQMMPQIGSALNAYQAKLMADLKSDPAKTIMREMRLREKMSTAQEKARFVWMQVNKEYQQKLQDLSDRVLAGDIAGKILTDQSFKDLRTEVRSDGKYIGNQKPFLIATGDQGKSITLPDGTNVNLDLQRMGGTKTHFDSVRAEYKQALYKMDAWLNDSKNFDDPNFRQNALNRESISDYYYSLDALRPNDSTGIWDASFHIIENAIRRAGGRAGTVALKVMSQWGRVKMKAGWWRQRNSAIIHAARIEALKSHGQSWKDLSDYDLYQAGKWYNENVRNELAASWRRPEGGYKVGDKLSSGEVVTKEDMAQLEAEGNAISEAFGIAKSEGLQLAFAVDTLGDTYELRESHKTSPYMTTRRYNSDMRDVAQQISDTRNQWLEARKNNDKVAEAQAVTNLTKLFNENWNTNGMGRSFVSERWADFAKETPYDGQNGVFQQISNTTLPTLTSFDQLVDEVTRLSGQPRDEVASDLLYEFSRITSLWNDNANPEEDNTINPPKGEVRKNSFTQGSGKALAPSPFYVYGFQDTERATGLFAAAIHSRAMDALVGSLQALKGDLERQERAFAERVRAVGEKAALSENQQAKRNGDNSDFIDNISKRKAMLDSVINDLSGRERFDADATTSAGRTIGLLTGLLISSIPTTVRNVSPRWLGNALKKMTGSYLTAYPQATFQLWLKGLYNLGKGVGGSILDLRHDLPATLAKIRKEPKQAFPILLQSVVDGVFDRVLNHNADYMALEKAGILHRDNNALEIQNRALGSLMYQGKFPSSPITGASKYLNLVAGFIELATLPLRVPNPGLGDAFANVGTANAVNFGLDNLRKRLGSVFQKWSKTSYRNFDFNDPGNAVNLISAKELFPNSPDAENDLLHMRELYQAAGIDLNLEAIKYLKELQAGNKTAPLLNPKQTGDLQGTVINYVNRSSPTGSPLNLVPKNFLKAVVTPFLSWKTRMLSNLNNLFRVPATSTQKKFFQWAAMMAFTLLPFLIASAFYFTPVEEEMDRAIKKVLYNQIKATRQPWEREGIKSQAIGYGLSAAQGIPFLDMAATAAFNDLPNRASVDPSIAVVEKTKDILRYIGGVVQTGDVTYKLPELIGGLVPDAKIVLNRLESQEGKRANNNAVAVIRRKADVDSLRPVGSSTGVNVTPLTPYSEKIENAILSGDQGKIQEVFNEAVSKAKEMGIENPEQRVKQLALSRSPYNRALKIKMTDEQRKAFLDRLTPEEKSVIDASEKAFTQAAETLGGTATFSKAQKSPTIGQGSTKTTSGSYRSPLASRGSKRRLSGGIAGLGRKRTRKISIGLRKRKSRLGKIRVGLKRGKRRV